MNKVTCHPELQRLIDLGVVSPSTATTPHPQPVWTGEVTDSNRINTTNPHIHTPPPPSFADNAPVQDDVDGVDGELEMEEFLRSQEAERQKLEEEVARKHADRVEEAKLFALPFPQTAMKGSLADLAHTLLDGSEVPVEFGFMAAVTVFGLIAAERLRIKDDPLKITPNLFTVLIAPTGGKKSTAVRKTVEFFQDGLGLSRNLDDAGSALVIDKVGSGEGLIQLFLPKVKIGDKWTNMPRHRVLLVPDEFQEVLSKCRIESSTLGPMLTSLFEGITAANATKDRAISVDHAHLGMCGCITTKLWEETWVQGQERSLGLLNRLFLVSSLPLAPVFHPPMDDKRKLSILKNRIYQQLSGHNALEITPEAKYEFEKFYKQLDQTKEETTRIDTLVKKLALILAVTNDKVTIDEMTALRAIRLGEYQLKVRELLNPSEAQNVTAICEEKILQFLKRNPDKSFTIGKLLDRTRLRKRVGTTYPLKAIENLCKVDEIEMVQGKYKLKS